MLRGFALQWILQNRGRTELNLAACKTLDGVASQRRCGLRALAEPRELDGAVGRAVRARGGLPLHRRRRNNSM